MCGVFCLFKPYQDVFSCKSIKTGIISVSYCSLINIISGYSFVSRINTINLPNKFVYVVLRFWIYLFLRIYYGFRVRGVSNLPKSGGYILSVNHQSFLDPFIAGVPVPNYIIFMARNTLWDHLIVRIGNYLLGCMTPIKRGTADKGALREGMKQLDQNRVILLFPEGTRTGDGSLGRIKKGPAFISQRSAVPVVPTVIKGAFEIWPKGKKIPHIPGWPFYRLSIAYGEPIKPGNYGSLPKKERVEAMSEDIAESMQKLFDGQ